VEPAVAHSRWRGMQIWTINGGQVVSRVNVVGETGTAEHALLPWSIVASY
jgi:hypothetical protein